MVTQLSNEEKSFLLYLKEQKVLPEKSILFTARGVKRLVENGWITNNLYGNGYFLELTDKSLDYLRDKNIEPKTHYYCNLPIFNNNKDLSFIKIGDSLEVSLFEISNSLELFFRRLQTHSQKIGSKEISLTFVPTKDFNNFRHVFTFK